MVRLVPKLRVAIIAGLVATAALPVVAGVANASARHTAATRHTTATPRAATPRATATSAPSPATRSFPTTVAAVRLRKHANMARTTKVIGTVHRVGTVVVVRCYLTGPAVHGDAVWYRAVSPMRGFVPGYYLKTGHDPVAGLPQCAATVR